MPPSCHSGGLRTIHGGCPRLTCFPKSLRGGTREAPRMEEQVIGPVQQMEAGRLRDREQENARLKKLAADLSLDKNAPQTVIR